MSKAQKIDRNIIGIKENRSIDTIIQPVLEPSLPHFPAVSRTIRTAPNPANSVILMPDSGKYPVMAFFDNNIYAARKWYKLRNIPAVAPHTIRFS